MYNALPVSLIQDPRKSAGKNALCVVIDQWKLQRMNRWYWRNSFFCKGHLDGYRFTMYRIYPAGDKKTFHLRLDANMKKAIGNKKAGDTVYLSIDKDRMTHPQSREFNQALFEGDREPGSFYLGLEKEQQGLFTEWMALAPTDEERLKRTSLSIEALRSKQTFSKMMLAHRAAKKELRS
ncbi:MAG: hypothetical protein K9G41_08295 [Flavobacteriales bacterium]|nr:hypothetical protein [Flavobacteriales bacterium]